MKQSNSVSINITVIYIVKEHCCIFTHIILPQIIKLDEKLYQIATLDAVCSLLCLFLLHFILSHI